VTGRPAAGPGPGVVKVRREPGARLYLTIRLSADLAQTGARPPRRATGRRQLTAREEP